jgi:hypothetical protein
MGEPEKHRFDLPSVIGEELSSVCFVRDYIELHFDGPVLRLLGDVTVQNGTEIKVLQDQGFRDWLCRNIGRRVATIDPLDGNQIQLKFHGNDLIRVEGKALGTKFAEFVNFPERRTQIWEVD